MNDFSDLYSVNVPVRTYPCVYTMTTIFVRVEWKDWFITEVCSDPDINDIFRVALKKDSHHPKDSNHFIENEMNRKTKRFIAFVWLNDCGIMSFSLENKYILKKLFSILIYF